MAAQNPDRVHVEIRAPNGTVKDFIVPLSFARLLQDPSTDNAIKEMVTANLINETNMDPKSSSEMSLVDSRPKETQWDEKTEKLLLDCYKQLETSKSLCKNKWKAVCEKVNRHGYTFTPEKCRLKVKSLKEKYDRIKRKNGTSGESPSSDDDNDLGEIFDTFPDMKPTYIVDSGVASTSGSCTEVISDEDEKMSETTKKRKRPRRSVDEITNFLEQHFKEKEVAAKKRHEEKMTAINALIAVMQEVAKK